MMINKKINWFWAHRRNSSLHHMSILAVGLRSKGWKPAVDFWFDNQIFVGVPGKGVYLFYDKDQLSSKDKYKNIWKSVDSNPDFVTDYKKQTDKIFGNVFAQCKIIDKDNLEIYNKKNLHNLYKKFIDAITVCPIITVQLWGIEALWNEDYKIAEFLKQKTKNKKEFEKYKEILSINTGETVAFTEKKDFFGAANILDKKAIKNLFEKENLESVSQKLLKFKKENKAFENHIKKYEWMNTEYVSEGWSREKWLELFKKALFDKISPRKRQEELKHNFKLLNKKRNQAIQKLNPPQDVRHALDALAELISQRDWAKGYFTKILLSYSKLLKNFAGKIGVEILDILNYSYEEIFDYLKNNKKLSKKELDQRKKYGFVYLVKNGKGKIISGENSIKNIIELEEISSPFEQVKNIKEFRGLAVSRGKITGIARMLEDASKIPEFKNGEIIVTYMTTMEFTPIFRKASAVITDEGGMSCHAAIVSREFNLPCIVGTKVATRVIKTGDKIEVDANNGVVKILNK